MSRTGTYDMASRLISEENITNLIKSITDNHSYVISYGEDKVLKDKVLKCVIDGYYFELTKLPSDVWVKIKYKDFLTHKLIDGDGEGNKFMGLDVYTSVETAPEDAFCLLRNGRVYEDSFVKFTPESQGLTTIDGGLLK